LIEIFLLFLKLGATGFGGPIALIALMEQECVRQRGWISHGEFNEAYLFCKLLPGPVAYQMALWMGAHVRGRLGGLVAGLSFLFPGVILVLGLTLFYGALAQAQAFGQAMEGMRSAALAVIGESVWRMLVPYRRDPLAFALIAFGVVGFLIAPRAEPLLIIAGGLAIVFSSRQAKGLKALAWPVAAQLFWTHFKAGIFVFGTGLAIIPYLQAEVVGRLHWLGEGEFLDGIAFGQITPGPVTITSVFIGYRVAGLAGSLIAAAGMYTPGILLILGVVPWLRRRLAGSPHLSFFQRGAVPTVVGCLIGGSLILGRASVTGWASWFVLGISAILLWKRLPGWLVIPLGSFLALGWHRLSLP
jgi:chromate transporter